MVIKGGGVCEMNRLNQYQLYQQLNNKKLSSENRLTTKVLYRKNIKEGISYVFCEFVSKYFANY